jgi:putative transposase
LQERAAELFAAQLAAGRFPRCVRSALSSPSASLAALIAVKMGHGPLGGLPRPPRRCRKDKRKGFTEPDYVRLLDNAHQQLGGPLVLVRDNLKTHVSKRMCDLIAARDWLTVFELPRCTSELNPVESVWSHLKRFLASLAERDIVQLTALESPGWGACRTSRSTWVCPCRSGYAHTWSRGSSAKRWSRGRPSVRWPTGRAQTRPELSAADSLMGSGAYLVQEPLYRRLPFGARGLH